MNIIYYSSYIYKINKENKIMYTPMYILVLRSPSRVLNASGTLSGDQI